MNKKQYLDFHKSFCEEMINVTKMKNADYSGAGDDPFSNFRQIGHLIQTDNVVEIGFLTRMSDKFSRIGSFISNGTLQVKDESVEDTLHDLANYCALFAGYLKSERLKAAELKNLTLKIQGVESEFPSVEMPALQTFGKSCEVHDGSRVGELCPECGFKI